MKNRRGFTLIEMSIVLVILALLAASIVLAQQMIRTAQFGKIARDAQRYKAAVATFKLKYNQLPGDFNQGVQLFNLPGCAGAPQYCNGNNDGTIGGSWGGATWPSYSEYQFMWADLAGAGLIEALPGTYTDFTSNAKPGINSPAGAIAGSGFCYTNIPVSGNLAGGAGYLYVGDYSVYPGSSACLSTPAPTQLWNNEEIRAYDRKYDDGNASTGGIRGADGYWGHCVVGGLKTSDYETTVPAWSNCMIAYYNPW